MLVNGDECVFIWGTERERARSRRERETAEERGDGIHGEGRPLTRRSDPRKSNVSR